MRLFRLASTTRGDSSPQMHPTAMAERAAVLESKEAPLRKHDTDRRRSVPDAMQTAAGPIDNELSAEPAADRTRRLRHRIAAWL